MNILQASEKYLREIMKIQVLCYANEFIESEEVIKNIINFQKSMVVQQKTDGKIIGYILAHPWNDLNIPPKLNTMITCKNGCDIFIHDLAIHPEFQNQGIGRELFTNLSFQNKQVGFSLVAIQNSLTFWSKFGFKQIGLASDDYGKNAVHMSFGKM